MKFSEFEELESKIPKELVREYTTAEGKKVRELVPMVYGYTMTIGPDKKPRIREFGNVRASKFGIGGFNKPEISSEMEPLTDINTTDKEMKVILEMPGGVNAYDNKIEVKSEDPQRVSQGCQNST